MQDIATSPGGEWNYSKAPAPQAFGPALEQTELQEG
jgi:hypothetical protein